MKGDALVSLFLIIMEPNTQWTRSTARTRSVIVMNRACFSFG